MARRKKTIEQQLIESIIIADEAPFEILGIINPPYSIVYRRKDNCELIILPYKNHKKEDLLQLADEDFWKMFVPGKKIDAFHCLEKLSFEANKNGKFHPEKLRGFGAWMDNGKPIYNDGETISGTKIQKFETKYYYTTGMRITDENPSNPQPDIKKVFALMGFSDGEKIMLGGWCAIAPICGALRWRPHIWITADHGAGKSVILDRIVKPLVGKALIPASNTTEAGIRQALNNDAVPIIFDEAEGKTFTSKENMNRVLELARKSSGNNNSVTYKGTPGGKHFAYIIQSMFCFASINPLLDEAADESRISVLEYERLDAEKWAELEAEINRQLTLEKCSSLRNHIIKNIETVIKSCDVVFQEINNQAGNARLADQYSPLVAGWWHIEHTEIIPKEEAEKLIAIIFKDKNQKRIENNGTPDSEQCLEDIATTGILTNGKQEAIRSLLYRWINDDGMDTSMKNILNSVGISLTHDKNFVVIHEKNTEFRRLMLKTPWLSGVRLVIGRLPGVVVGYKTYMAGKSCSTIKIPIGLIVENEEWN